MQGSRELGFPSKEIILLSNEPRTLLFPLISLPLTPSFHPPRPPPPPPRPLPPLPPPPRPLPPRSSANSLRAGAFLAMAACAYSNGSRLKAPQADLNTCSSVHIEDARQHWAAQALETRPHCNDEALVTTRIHVRDQAFICRAARLTAVHHVCTTSAIPLTPRFPLTDGGSYPHRVTDSQNTIIGVIAFTCFVLSSFSCM